MDSLAVTCWWTLELDKNWQGKWSAVVNWGRRALVKRFFNKYKSTSTREVRQIPKSSKRGETYLSLRPLRRNVYRNGTLPQQFNERYSYYYKEFLKSRIRITEFEAKCYVIQLIEGLEYLHRQGIVHRDIKLGNVFLSNKMQVKIGDFGLSAKVSHNRERRFTTCGTPNYIAP